MVYSRGKSAVPERRGGGTRILFLVFGVLGLVIIASGIVLLLGYAPFGLELGESELLVLWNAGDYGAVSLAATAILASDPLDAEAVTFAGFAAFYSGIEAVQADEQVLALEEATRHLRRALLLPRAPFADERDYVLGKTYFHRGDAYLDLATFYLERAIAAGHQSTDARTYLGLAYSSLGDYEASVAWFQDALVHARPEDVDSIRIEAADAQLALGAFPAAVRLLTDALDSLEDDYLRLVARNQLALVHIAAGNSDEALSLLEDTIERYPESADAYYYLGVIYDDADDSVLARDFWRRAREIDPDHQEALRRLANREG